MLPVLELDDTLFEFNVGLSTVDEVDLKSRTGQLHSSERRKAQG